MPIAGIDRLTTGPRRQAMEEPSILDRLKELAAADRSADSLQAIESEIAALRLLQNRLVTQRQHWSAILTLNET
jgi:hypothetical protein